MQIKKLSIKLNTAVACLVFVLAFSISIAGLTGSVGAIRCPDGSTLPDAQADQCPDANGNPPGGPVDEEVETIDFQVNCQPDEGISLDRKNCGIINIIVIAINFLSAVAGVVFVLSIMISGFQYMTAQDNAGQIEKAKSRITMTLLALVIYIFMYALLNFLVPGGVL